MYAAVSERTMLNKYLVAILAHAPEAKLAREEKVATILLLLGEDYIAILSLVGMVDDVGDNGTTRHCVRLSALGEVYRGTRLTKDDERVDLIELIGRILIKANPKVSTFAHLGTQATTKLKGEATILV